MFTLSFSVLHSKHHLLLYDSFCRVEKVALLTGFHVLKNICSLFCFFFFQDRGQPSIHILKKKHQGSSALFDVIVKREV